jgi:disulfide bond formation protein DsbB
MATSTELERRGNPAAEVTVALGVTLGGVAIILGAWFTMTAAQRRLTPGAEPTAVIEVAQQGPPLDGAAYGRGRANFVATCSACHGETGTGKQGLGKDVTKSAFVAKSSDEFLVKFLNTGRAADDPLNTTKIPMPPKGGNASFTDADLQDIVVFMRGLQAPSRVPTLAPAATPPPPPAPAAAAALAGDDAKLADALGYSPEEMTQGQKLFVTSCASCHGADGKGMPGLGKDFTKSAFVAGLDDDKLIAFIKQGRPASDPANTTKVDMPPKGGNPSLNDEKLDLIVGYLRLLQVKAKPKG